MLHTKWMQYAFQEAELAREKGEVPIGAVIVQNNEIIGRGHNLKETLKLPTAHAEIQAIENASQTIGDWRLLESSLYVTIEPCIMCLGAIIQARIDKVFYGAPDPKFGGVESLLNYGDLKGLNHFTEFTGGVEADKAITLLREFFREARKKQKMER